MILTCYPLLEKEPSDKQKSIKDEGPLTELMADILITSFKLWHFVLYPTTRQRPIFSKYLKNKHYVWKFPSIRTHFTYPVFMFKSLFLITFLMIIISIFLPLLWFRKKVSPHGPAPLRGYYLFYFSCLGLGFMLVEIPLIQKFILLLGQPLYSIAVILAALLISSGVGSLLSGRISEKASSSALRGVICVICALVISTIYGLPVLFDACLGMSTAVRVLFPS